MTSVRRHHKLVLLAAATLFACVRLAADQPLTGAGPVDRSVCDTCACAPDNVAPTTVDCTCSKTKVTDFIRSLSAPTQPLSPPTVARARAFVYGLRTGHVGRENRVITGHHRACVSYAELEFRTGALGTSPTRAPRPKHFRAHELPHIPDVIFRPVSANALPVSPREFARVFFVFIVCTRAVLLPGKTIAGVAATARVSR